MDQKNWKISAIDQATITEHLCIVKIKKLSLDASIVHMGKSDIIIQFDSGLLLRVQVKSSRVKRHASDRKGFGYHFSITSGSKKKTPISKRDADILAFVSFDREKIFFMHTSELRQKYTKRFPRGFFDQEDNIQMERESLQKSVRIHHKINKIEIQNDVKEFLELREKL